MRLFPLIARLFLLIQPIACGLVERSVKSSTADLSLDELRVELRKAERNATNAAKRIEEINDKLGKNDEAIAKQDRIVGEKNATWSKLNVTASELMRPFEEEKHKAERIIEDFERLEREAKGKESEKLLAEQDLKAATSARSSAKDAQYNVSLWRRELNSMTDKEDLAAQVNALEKTVKVRKSALDYLSAKADRRKSELARRGCDRNPDNDTCKAISLVLLHLKDDIAVARSAHEAAELALRVPHDALTGYDRRRLLLRQQIDAAGDVGQRVRAAEAAVEERQRALAAAQVAVVDKTLALRPHSEAAEAARSRAAATLTPDVAAAVEAAQLAEDALDEAKSEKRSLVEEKKRLGSEARKAQEVQKEAQAKAASLKTMLETANVSEEENEGISAGAISGIIIGIVIFILVAVIAGFFVFRNRNRIRRNGTESEAGIESKDIPEGFPLMPRVPPTAQVTVAASAPPNRVLPIHGVEKRMRELGLPVATPETIRDMNARGTTTQGQNPSIARNIHDTNRSDSGYDDASPRTTGGESADRKCSPYAASLVLNDEESSPLPKSTFESEFLKKFTPIKIVGQGGYGCVFEAEFKLIKERYAVKRIPLRYPSFLKRDADVIAEAANLAKMDHPNIVRYINSWIEHPPVGWQREADDMMLREMDSDEHLFKNDRYAFLYIQMELCQSTLADWLKENNRRDLNQIKHWFKQLVSAVGYMHLNGKMHRDLKPGNILFVGEDRVKICDLGIATVREINEGQENAKTRTFGQGTSMYMAPEQKGYNYTCKVDIFALGLILAELCVQMSDEKAEEVFDNYRRGRSSDVLSGLPDVEQFVGWLTKLEPDDRPECSEILRHTFLA